MASLSSFPRQLARSPTLRLSGTDAKLLRHRPLPLAASLRSYPSARPFSYSRCVRQKQHQQNHRTESFRFRLRAALKNTKLEWKPIPIGLGIGFLGLMQFYRVQAREKKRLEEEEEARYSGDEDGTRPKKRPRVRPSGPWYEAPYDFH
jgi:phosphatidylserine decarboxylase